MKRVKGLEAKRGWVKRMQGRGRLHTSSGLHPGQFILHPRPIQPASCHAAGGVALGAAALAPGFHAEFRGPIRFS